MKKWILDVRNPDCVLTSICIHTCQDADDSSLDGVLTSARMPTCQIRKSSVKSSRRVSSDEYGKQKWFMLPPLPSMTRRNVAASSNLLGLFGMYWQVSRRWRVKPRWCIDKCQDADDSSLDGVLTSICADNCQDADVSSQEIKCQVGSTSEV